MKNNNWQLWAAAAALIATLLAAQAQEQGTIRDRRVNVRGQPALLGEVVTQLKEGDSITILEDITLEKPKKGEPSKWLRIALPANTPVWVHTDFIDATAKTVKPRRLNFRAGPGENYSVLGRFEQGVAVKEISQKGAWLEVEAPADAYAFIAADLVTRSPAVAATPPPTTRPAPIALPPPQPLPFPTPIVTAPPPAQPQPDRPAPIFIPVPADTRPAPRPIAIASTPPGKRIVRREGILQPTISIQAPTYYELESVDTGKTIAYLHTSSTNLALRDLKGRRLYVTGEEFVDKRWANAPVLEIDNIELVP